MIICPFFLLKRRNGTLCCRIFFNEKKLVSLIEQFLSCKIEKDSLSTIKVNNNNLSK